MRSRLFFEPRLHTALDLVLFQDFALRSFAPAELNAFANIDGVLHVLPGRVIREGYDQAPDFFLGCGHDVLFLKYGGADPVQPSPMPPAPISATISYGPSLSPGTRAIVEQL
jgi:hypothetical protein